MEIRKRGIEAYRRIQKVEPRPGVDPGEADSSGTGFPRRGRRPEEREAPGKLSQEKLDKIARFLILVGKEQAAEVVKHLDPPLVEAVAARIANIPAISPREAHDILEEFRSVREVVKSPRGGKDVAKTILEAAFGEERAGRILSRIEEAERRPFSFLQDLTPRQIKYLLQKEAPAIVSAILSYLDPAKVSGVLTLLPPEVRVSVVKYIARPRKLDKEILLRVEEALRKRLHELGDTEVPEVDGVEVLAEILKHAPLEEEEKILKALKDRSPELVGKLEERLLTLDILEQIPDRELAGILRKFDDTEIALLLKGKPEEVKARIMRNISERRRQMVTDEYLRLGAVKRRDVEQVTKDFLGELRQLVREGRVILSRDQKEYLM
ncbi:flagellar motor switch protein FliG [Spirochaeta thermophila DSM 6578]|uniref:Flagellar motor switch protein FliG n=1 Tax=Winmispira thermophila (strain ATCC 700085 / DSM 6578 / Z-1203) TaxID=869211 RepID=G0GBQ8_WINT7|nr:flagellar motor switch protein FliG [Spirochaeta thermophila]AEJ61136.1 flagellar motor switch protein FliG [Spirochaeta thermophila DSM 6578]